MSNFGNMSLTERQEIIELASITAVNMAFSTFEKSKKEQRIKRSDMRLHRTDLLMRNFRALDNHCKNAVFEKRKYKESAIDLLDDIDDYIDDDLYIDSIKKSTQKTLIIVTHVKNMLEVYKLLVEKSKEPIQLRRYNAMYLRHVDDSMPSIQFISNHLKIDRSVVYDDINIAFQIFGPYVFGIDSVKIK